MFVPTTYKHQSDKHWRNLSQTFPLSDRGWVVNTPICRLPWGHLSGKPWRPYILHTWLVRRVFERFFHGRVNCVHFAWLEQAGGIQLFQTRTEPHIAVKARYDAFITGLRCGLVSITGVHHSDQNFGVTEHQGAKSTKNLMNHVYDS